MGQPVGDPRGEPADTWLVGDEPTPGPGTGDDVYSWGEDRDAVPGHAHPGGSDQQVVALLLARDPLGMAAVYDRYAPRLLDYAAGMLRDRDLAGDVVHDTLLIAGERVGQLRDPDRLRPWLYAIARRECLRLLRARSRHAELDEAGQLPDDRVDLGESLRARELRDLVRAAMDGLNPGDREVVELTLRHGMDGAALASALGVSRNQAHATASRARVQLERALAVVIVARTGRQACGRLAELLGVWDGVLTPLWRKRMARHIESCPSCGDTRRRNASAAALLGAVPFLMVPPLLRMRLVAEHSDTSVDMVSYRVALARDCGRFNRDGFPRFPDRRGRWPVIAALPVLALLIGSTLVLGGYPNAGPRMIGDLVRHNAVVIHGIFGDAPPAAATDTGSTTSPANTPAPAPVAVPAPVPAAVPAAVPAPSIVAGPPDQPKHPDPAPERIIAPRPRPDTGSPRDDPRYREPEDSDGRQHVPWHRWPGRCGPHRHGPPYGWPDDHDPYRHDPPYGGPGGWGPHHHDPPYGGSGPHSHDQHHHDQHHHGSSAP
jgi:RNA polymerase sigma factor (sigma-70 family)